MHNVNSQKTPLFIDSDNALGAPFGDIDDAFAICALLKSGYPIDAVSSVFGNSFEPWVFKNHQTLTTLCEFDGKLLRGASTRWSGPTEASRYLVGLNKKVRILAIGPMTNVALALRKNTALAKYISEIIFIGTNLSLPLPAFRFFDFNQWKDPRSTREIFHSEIPLTCIPCDVARNFRVTKSQLTAIPGKLGEHLRKYSARWFRRARVLKGLSSVPIWDLVAATYIMKPYLFETLTTTAELGRMGQGVFGRERGRPIQLITKFNTMAVWDHFISVVSKEHCDGRNGPA